MDGGPRLRTDGEPDGRLIGRYALFGEIASGGMASVHYARLNGPAGFSRTVAIKRMHPYFAKDPEFVAMFLDEARLAARIRHPNVVPTLDVVTTEGEIFLVMEYVQGESLGKLLRSLRGRPSDTRIMSTVMSNVLLGLHAAHEAKNEQGDPLGIVHRDVSPQNVLVGVDGVARVLDFGVAKAIGRLQSTREGQVKGKLSYMAPEQLHNAPVTRRSDIYAASVVTWEALTGRRLFKGDSEAAMITAVLQGPVFAPSSAAPHVPVAVDNVIMRGLNRDPERRYATAKEMALELERVAGVASPSEVGDWVETLAHEELSKRASRVAQIESVTSSDPSRISPLSSTDMPTTLTTPSAHEPDNVPCGDGSGVSSIAVAPELSSAPQQRGKVVALRVGGVVAGGGMLILVGLVIGLSRRSSPQAEHEETKTAGVSQAAATPLALAAVPMPPSAASIDPAQSSQSAAASSSTPATTVVLAGGARVSHGGGTKPSTSATTPQSTHAVLAPNSDCSPPYWYDAQSHKHWKEACLK
jgi:serine/threonine protein kinase